MLQLNILIHFIKLSPNPQKLRIAVRNGQDTELNAFSKSINNS